MSDWLGRVNRWLLENPWLAVLVIVVLPVLLDAAMYAIPALVLFGAYWQSQRQRDDE